MYIIPQEPAKVYNYNELSDKAKEVAYQEWYDRQCNIGYVWGDEFVSAINEFAKLFNLKIKDYSLSAYSYSYIDFEIKDNYYCNVEDIENLSGIRLYKYIYNILVNEWVKPDSKFYVNKNGKHIKYINDCSQKVYEKNGKVRYSNIFPEDGRELYYSCPLTGSFADDFYYSVIVDFMKHPYDITFKELLEDAFKALVKDYQADEENFFSREYFEETDATDTIYYETGKEYGEYSSDVEKYKVNKNVEFELIND